MTQEEAAQRQYNALHKIQTGVNLLIQAEANNLATPKHLRVGVEAAYASAEGLAQLLVDKGIVSIEEVAKYTTEAMEARANDIEKEVRVKYGNPGVEINIL